MSVQRRFDVAGLGLCSIDLLCTMDGFPERNEKTPMSAFEIQGGGQAGTAMVACSRLGLRAAYGGVMGDDWIGRLSLESLREEGVDVGGVVRKRGRSLCAIVLIDARSAERTIVYDRELVLEASDVRREWVTSARCLLLDGYDLAAQIRAARWARQAGIPVVFDAERVDEETATLLELSDYVIGSETFPQRLTGEHDSTTALRALHARVGGVVGMTLGALGAIAFDGQRWIESPGFEVAAVDATGAGDVFHGGFCYGLLQDWPLGRRLDFANAFAALSCRETGGRKGIPRLDEVEALVRERARR